MSMNSLLSLRTAKVTRRPPCDYVYLSDVVRINYPVRDARIYINRHLGNPVSYRLVEARLRLVPLRVLLGTHRAQLADCIA